MGPVLPYGECARMDSPIVTRFAPSPTGFLHLGHALAAWEARSLADRFSGRCVLRMEDIDQTRSRPEFVQAILEDLDWLGIRFDGPMMVQSSRFGSYEHALQVLKDRGVLYPCFCTRREIAEEVAAMGAAPQEGGTVDVYPGTCLKLDKVRRKELMKSGKPFSWRLDCRAAARITGSACLAGHAVRRAGVPPGGARRRDSGTQGLPSKLPCCRGGG